MSHITLDLVTSILRLLSGYSIVSLLIPIRILNLWLTGWLSLWFGPKLPGLWGTRFRSYIFHIFPVVGHSNLHLFGRLSNPQAVLVGGSTCFSSDWGDSTISSHNHQRKMFTQIANWQKRRQFCLNTKHSWTKPYPKMSLTFVNNNKKKD